MSVSRWSRAKRSASLRLHSHRPDVFREGKHRAQRRREEHLAQDSLARYRADIGQGQGQGRIASLLEVGAGFHPRSFDRLRTSLTGRENIYLNGAILGMKHDEITRKFDEIVDFSGVEKFIDTPSSATPVARACARPSP